ncbi:hypothetical protein EDEG_03786 [Edhazardia aedis USNM 41457]|uniref:Ubiquitinyl hydrolase 1 n=1 Tax=Edhazardia aedis (strain USNM 41457) TaxID=1003232 RepID=J9D266_EDHAE|nr:hypothetical protein EDEG_03786 [Edhazardia aedis USNM 41457]|eukprot:EJW01669.1 hypothetical protein EDEG_03786 [Edhazardia aedis USNM 41457]
MSGNCQITNNLYFCISCGNFACGRAQIGFEGNGHALEHFKKSYHYTAIHFNSLGMDGSNRTYCYLCESFIFNDNLFRDFQTIGFDLLTTLKIREKLIHKVSYTLNGKLLDENFSLSPEKDTTNYSEKTKNNNCRSISADLNSKNIIPYESEEKSSEVNPSDEILKIQRENKIVGILNNANSCYISTVLHLLSNFVNEPLDSHFFTCELLPTQCFYCQFIKIINVLQGKSTYIDTINIEKFLDLAEMNSPFFNRTVQGDIQETLNKFLGLLKIYANENIELHNELDKLNFNITKEFIAKCGHENTEIITSYDNIVLEYNDNIQKSINNFLYESKNCCCGKPTETKISINVHPEYLIVTLNRCEFADGKVTKIFDSRNCDNREYIMLEDVKYKRIAAILHRGTTPQCGHYVFKKNWYILNDSRLQLAEDIPKNMQGEEYMILYERVKLI